MMTAMTQKEFWSLPKVQEQQEIQKRNPYASEPHLRAFVTIVKLMADIFGKEFATEYMGSYSD